MAWILRKEDSNEEYRLLANKEYVVGRKEADIILGDDLSISRKHAVISVSHHENNVSNINRLPTVMIKDFSKYGTKVNEKTVDGNGTLINSNDKILFGILNNVWRLKYKPVICCSSVLNKEEKLLARKKLARLGGHLLAEWTSQCDLLLMSDISITMKVVNALVSRCHIVQIKYLSDYVYSLENNFPQPNPKSYVPPLTDSVLQGANVSFLPDERRRTVFSDKKFYVLSAKQMKKLEYAVKSGGGEILMLTKELSTLKKILNDQASCILRPSSSEVQEKFFIQLSAQLDRLGLRFIAECEVGLAILHCTTEAFCNTRCSGDNEFLLGSLQSSVDFSQSASIADNGGSFSQDIEFEIEPSKEHENVILSDTKPEKAVNVVGDNPSSIKNIIVKPALMTSVIKQETLDPSEDNALVVKRLQSDSESTSSLSFEAESQSSVHKPLVSDVVSKKEQKDDIIKQRHISPESDTRHDEDTEVALFVEDCNVQPKKKLRLKSTQRNSTLIGERTASSPVKPANDSTVIDLTDDDDEPTVHHQKCPSNENAIRTKTIICQNKEIRSNENGKHSSSVEDYGSEIKQEEPPHKKPRVNVDRSKAARPPNDDGIDAPPQKRPRIATNISFSSTSSHDADSSFKSTTSPLIGYLSSRKNFLGSSDESIHEKMLDRSLVNVTLVSLVRMHLHDLCSTPFDGTRKNFKKFKKVLPKYAEDRRATFR